MTSGLPDDGRIPGLDAWRAGLLLVGILLHGSIGLPGTILFTALDIVSQTFRMGCFFGIAGALSAVAIARRSPDAWIRGRLIRLGIPLCVTMAIVPPLVWALASTWGWASPAPPVPFDWYHLWFLVALTLYSVLLHRLIASKVDDAVAPRITRWIDAGRPTASIAILVTGCASACLFAVSPPLMALALTPRFFAAYCNIQLIAGYAPMFLFGAMAVRLPAFGARLLAEWRTAAAIVAVIAAAYVGWFCLTVPRVSSIDAADAAIVTANLRFIAASLCPPAAFILILRSALAIRAVPTLVTRMSEASYTIYLLHLPLAATINLPLHAIGVETHTSYAVAVMASGTLSYLFHRGCVRRSTVLQLLLNGRIPRKAAVATYSSDAR